MLRVGLRCMSFKLPGQLTVTGPEPVSALPKGFVAANEVYKPKEQVEYDLKGQTLLYSAPQFAGRKVFYPIQSFTKWTIPLQGVAWYLGLFGNYSFLAPVTMYLSLAPFVRYLETLRYSVEKIWLVRGSHWLIQTSGEHFITKFSISKQVNVAVLDEKGRPEKYGKYAEYLNEDGQLKRDVKIQMTDWMEFQEAKENQILQISVKGKVHNPELLQALLQGYKIDDTGFRVNEDPENSLVSNVCIGGSLRPKTEQ